ncbi:hypothetical protein [Alkalicoccus luteus]|uniref:Uncharacterized protein n=1 Tax=Alkalicoccus luteus TaxID=1237094 RepID=A0A969TTF2_9BACI|nr:hypothetical protein [Alkalicoccus luteus]NJP37598.1 hypothetical protein [Alkalicoccus luteus]
MKRKLIIGVAVFSVSALVIYLMLDILTEVPVEVAVMTALAGGFLLEWSYFQMKGSASADKQNR